MGLFVVGRLAARHGVRVRLRHGQAGGLTALIWLPDTVAPPLGRLRRFEADDCGPVSSLSAPPQASGTGAQATTTARIPRFSPPSSPSPAAGTGAPGGPVVGQAAGTGWEKRGDSPQAPADGIVAGEGAAPASLGTLAGPGGPAVAVGPGPGGVPAFGGPATQSPPTGSQDLPGGVGPGAATVADASQGSDGGSEPGQVTVLPPGQEQRLPIFDSLESDWFRRSGKTMTGPQRALGGQAGQGSWTSPADEGWRAAQVVASPAAGDTTQAGLPTRVPRANLVPGSVGSGGPGSRDAPAEAPARSADAARSRMASFQRGVREGRAAAPQIEEP
jgi:hypothetical protein